LRVAVFDSGVGGLSVVRSMVMSQCFEEIIYFGDTARVPYGSKDANTIVRYSLEALEFFKNFDVDSMVVACNSASAHALSELRNHAEHDIHGVIEPGVLALQSSGIKKNASILVIGTHATIRSGSYQFHLKNLGYESVTAIATPLLVPLVEERITDESIIHPTLTHYFKNIPTPDAIILGCTHFPLLERYLHHYFPNSQLIHSGDAIVEYLKQHHALHGDYPPSKERLKLFASENAHHLKQTAEQWIWDSLK